MKNKILLSTVLIFFLSVYSCKKDEKAFEKEYINNLIDKLSFNEDTKWLVILPGLGCQGCIQEGEVFIRDYVNNKEIYFVLTKIESLKILQNKLEIKINEHSNIYTDKQVGNDMRSINSIYPCIVRLENGEMQSYEFQAPGNNAFEKLRNYAALAE